MSNQQHIHQHRQRVDEEALYQRKIQEAFNDYVKSYPINISYPAKVVSTTTVTNDSYNQENTHLRTNKDLIQNRLQESGIIFNDETKRQTMEDLAEPISKFISTMNSSGCYNAVQVKLHDDNNDDDNNTNNNTSLEVILDEKKWYRLYVGGGLKQSNNIMESSTLLPLVQFETSGSLQNLTGALDRTSLSYTIDQTSATNLMLSHDRPLYSVFSNTNNLRETLLYTLGSRYNLRCAAMLDTIDHEFTRSYKEYQRLVSLRLSNTSDKLGSSPPASTYFGLDWSMMLRDIIPRRHCHNPTACDASPEIVLQSGPTTKHSFALEFRTNGDYLTNDGDSNCCYNPTHGVDFRTQIEVATPPGDVGFAKAEGGLSFHKSFFDIIALHAGLTSGVLKPLSFGGLCGQPTVSDKFFVGGPMSLRGFLPAGVGPRSSTSFRNNNNNKKVLGDALGGNFFYTATLAASVPIKVFQNSDNDLRLFGFYNFGTVTPSTTPSLSSVINSTRASIGGGICTSSLFGGGRFEVTYAIPIRYGPRDVRKALQFGFGFNFS